MFRFTLRNWSLPIAAIAFLICSQQTRAENWSDKMFKVRSHDFRSVGRGSKSEFRFEFTNTYEEDVHVAGVRTSCGCTTPSVTLSTVKSLETSAIVAKFNTDTFVGHKSATITVVFDKPYYSETQLKVSGHIRTDISFSPPEVAFGEIAPGKTGETEVVITHNGDPNWRITDVRSHCTDLVVRLNPPERSPGTVKYRMMVRTKDSMPEGEIRERLTLISNDRDFPTTEMLISGRLRPALSISPASFSLGTAQPGQTIEKKLLLRAEEPFKVTNVVCADDRFDFEVPDASKKLQIVKLRFKADQAASKVSQEIRVETDLGKSASCVVTGSVGQIR